MFQSLHPGMGAAVLEHLARFVDLTNLLDSREAADGYIAGQAVASAVSELYSTGAGVVYNDVDAFLFSDKFERGERRVLSTLTSQMLERENDYGQLVLTSNAVYTVQSTNRTGMLNEIFCRFERDRFNKDWMAQAFLASFDLNCVQVGVRLSDGQLIWTPAFEQYMATREMLVMNVKTPVHTAVRWFKKKQELAGVFGHDEKTMALLASTIKRVNIRLAESQDGTRWHRHVKAQLCFGKIYAGKAADVAADLGKYFDVDDVTDRKIALQTLTPRGCEVRAFVEYEGYDLALPTYARALQGHWRRHVSDQIVQAMQRSMHKMSHMNVAVEGPAAIAALQSPKDLAMLDKACDEHPRLMLMMRHMATARQLEFLAILKHMSKREGMWVYGVFEELWRQEDFAAVESAALNEYMEACFAREVLHYDELGRTCASTIRRIATTPMLGYQITELFTFQELMEEGVRMHHCVGGYFSSVCAGTSRIFRLQQHRAEDSLTLELRQNGTGWYISQVQGLQNRAATSDEKLVATKLTQMVNMQAGAARLKLNLQLLTVERLAIRLPLLGRVLEALNTPAFGRQYWASKARLWTWHFKNMPNKVSWLKFGKATFKSYKPALAGADADLDDIPF